MSVSRKEVIAQTIFDWLNNPNRKGQTYGPYSYNENADALSIAVDGDLKCKDLAAVIDDALGDEADEDNGSRHADLTDTEIGR